MPSRFLRHLPIALGLGMSLTLGSPTPAPEAAQPPLKIGVLADLTGPAAEVNRTQVNGIKLRLKELNSEIAGRAVQLIVEDTAADPATGLTKARKLVERDQVEIVLGPLLSHVVTAIQDLIGRANVPHMVFAGHAPEAVKYPTMMVPVFNFVSMSNIFGRYAYGKLGYRQMVIMNSDFVYGRRTADGFREGFTAAGGKIVGEIYPPLGTPDFSPFLARLPKADAVYSVIPAADGIRYVKQRHEFGLRDRLPLLAIISTVEGTLLPAQGEAALGSLAITHYFEDLDKPVNRRFVAAYTKEYGATPKGYYPATGYTMVQILEEALKKTDGKTTPVDRVMAAIKGVDFDSPQGRFRFGPGRPYPITDYYIVRVVRKDGELGYEVVDIMKDITQ